MNAFTRRDLRNRRFGSKNLSNNSQTSITYFVLSLTSRREKLLPERLKLFSKVILTLRVNFGIFN